MASVKEHFSKGIGYIKYEIESLRSQRAELMEFINYHKEVNNYIAKIRVSKAQCDIESIDMDIYELKQQLKFYKEYFNYTEEELDAIKPATTESIKADWKRIKKESMDTSWTQADHDALMQRVHDLDVSLGRIPA